MNVGSEFEANRFRKILNVPWFMVVARRRENAKTATRQNRSIYGFLANGLIVSQIIFLGQPQKCAETREVAIVVHTVFVRFAVATYVFHEDRRFTREAQIKAAQNFGGIFEEIIDVDVAH